MRLFKEDFDMGLVMLPSIFVKEKAASFLTIWQRVLVFFPSGTFKNVDRFIIMCIMFEETRFSNIVQKGWERLAAKYDAGQTLTADEQSHLKDVAVGFSQVQIKEKDKRDVISGMGIDPEKLRFRDITNNVDSSVQLSCRYLFTKGLGAQPGGHPRRKEFLEQWPKSGAALRDALKKGNSIHDVYRALNSAILDSANHVPTSVEWSEYWDLIFPKNEKELLFSDQMRSLI